MGAIENNLTRILKISLALESYQDNVGENNDIIDKAFDIIGSLRERREFLTKKEQLEETNKVLAKLNEVLDIVGREKFIFYDDGDINYKWV